MVLLCQLLATPNFAGREEPYSSPFHGEFQNFASFFRTVNNEYAG